MATALGACGKHEARDNVVVELHAPIHAVVRAHEFDVKPECTETGLMRFRCFFQSELRGCAWLELGQQPRDEDRLGEAPRDEDLCTLAMVMTETTAPLETTPVPARGMELVADPSGSRLAWRPSADRPWHFFYLLEGELLREPGGSNTYGLLLDRPDATTEEILATPTVPELTGPLDWSKVPTLAQRAPDFVVTAQSSHLPRLLELIRKERGEVGLGLMLAHAMAYAEEPAWDRAWQNLSPAGRKAFFAELSHALGDFPSETALRKLSMSPELRPAGFADLLVRRIEEQLAEGIVEYDTTGLYLEALVQLADPRSGALACAWMEDIASQRLVTRDDYYPEMPGFESASPALIALARFRTPCPWVRVALEQAPCDADYRCTPKGIVETSAQAMAERQEAEDAALERGEELPIVEPQHALCTSEQASAVVKRWVPVWLASDDFEDEADFPEDVTTPPPGVLLLAAAWAQGPLPPELLERNARRQYRVDDRTPRPKGGEKEYEEPGACSLIDQGLSDPSELACQIPRAISQLRLGGCRIEIDDAKKVIHLTPPKPPEQVNPPRLKD
ncbi:MAG: hypothetical protein AMXMBFR34_10740 [Myxococcaceae bacterium]